EDEHYEFDHDEQSVELLPEGRQLVRSLRKPEAHDSICLITVYESLDREIRVNRIYTLDRHYVVRKGEIVIVYEFTGRLAEGRKWRGGIHPGCGSKEKVGVH